MFSCPRRPVSFLAAQITEVKGHGAETLRVSESGGEGSPAAGVAGWPRAGVRRPGAGSALCRIPGAAHDPDHVPPRSRPTWGYTCTRCFLKTPFGKVARFPCIRGFTIFSWFSPKPHCLTSWRRRFLVRSCWSRCPHPGINADAGGRRAGWDSLCSGAQSPRGPPASASCRRQGHAWARRPPRTRHRVPCSPRRSNPTCARAQTAA